MLSAIVISGSRDWKDNRYEIVKKELEKYPNSFIIVGDCRGVDSLAVRAAKELHYSFKIFVADWFQHGRAAGPKRNAEMIAELVKREEACKFVFSFHDNIAESKVTIDLMQQAWKKSVSVYHNDGKITKPCRQTLNRLCPKKSIVK